MIALVNAVTGERLESQELDAGAAMTRLLWHAPTKWIEDGVRYEVSSEVCHPILGVPFSFMGSDVEWRGATVTTVPRGLFDG